MSLLRFLMVLVGIATLTVYTAVAFAGFLLLQWIFTNPPDPLLVVAMFAVLVVLGGYIGYRQGVVRVVSSLDTHELSRTSDPHLYRRLERLSLQMDVTPPLLLVADLNAPNALSVGGPREGVVILDRRLFRLLTLEELEGILAHELAHIERYDTFLNTLVITASRLLVGLVFIAIFPVVVFLAGIDRATAWFFGQPQVRHFGLADLFQRLVGITVAIFFSLLTVLFLAHSRRQEFAADRRAATATGRPLALARALMKIERATDPRRGIQSLLYIHDERDHPQPNWLSTHPSLDDRVERLVDLAATEPHGQKLQRLRH